MMRAAVREVLGDDALRAVLRAAALGLLRRRRRGVPRRDRPELRAHPAQLPPPRVRRQALRDHRGRLPPPRPRDRRGRRARRLHASSTCTRCPGSQNQHWHSDNPTHRALFWEHRHFQDRVVGIWEAIADRYKGNPWVAGYNLMNEPADESRAVVGPFYERLSAAIRADRPGPHPLLRRQHLLDRVRLLRRAARERRLHAARLRARRASAAPTSTPGRESAEAKFLERSEYARRTGTPIYVGEFAPIYTGDEAVDARAPPDPRRPARSIYRRYGAGFATWMYKDLGRQGLDVRPARLALRRAGRRLRGQEAPARDRPVGEHRPREPRGHRSRSRTSSRARHRTSIPTRGAGSTSCARWCSTSRSHNRWSASTPSSSAGSVRTSSIALADSFAFEHCVVRESLRDQLSAA